MLQKFKITSYAIVVALVTVLFSFTTVYAQKGSKFSGQRFPDIAPLDIQPEVPAVVSKDILPPKCVNSMHGLTGFNATMKRDNETLVRVANTLVTMMREVNEYNTASLTLLRRQSDSFNSSPPEDWDDPSVAIDTLQEQIRAFELNLNTTPRAVRGGGGMQWNANKIESVHLAFGSGQFILDFLEDSEGTCGVTPKEFDFANLSVPGTPGGPEFLLGVGTTHRVGRANRREPIAKEKSLLMPPKSRVKVLDREVVARDTPKYAEAYIAIPKMLEGFGLSGLQLQCREDLLRFFGNLRDVWRFRTGEVREDGGGIGYYPEHVDILSAFSQAEARTRLAKNRLQGMRTVHREDELAGRVLGPDGLYRGSQRVVRGYIRGTNAAAAKLEEAGEFLEAAIGEALFLAGTDDFGAAINDLHGGWVVDSPFHMWCTGMPNKVERPLE